jgi:hypothetical protein
MGRQNLTTEQLAEKAAQDVRKMSPEEKAKLREHLDKELGSKRPRRMRLEYGVGSFLDYMSGPHGLVASAKKAAREQQLFLNFNPEGKLVN